jgi:RNA polymerase subunit RPABC4/transcription elongation factor Spt4
LPSSSGDKLCPICDSPLQPGSKKCGFCGTDLSIFDMDVEAPKPAPSPVTAAPPKPTVESRIEEIFSKPLVPEKPAPVRQAPPARPPAAPPPEVKKVEERTLAAEPEPKPATPTQEVAEEAVEYFECPQCGSLVETTASACPKCGVLFAEEGTEMFQCPACNTLVNVDAKSCPGCGAVFVEAEEEIPPTPAPPPVKKDLEPPVIEVKAPPKPAPALAKEEEKKGLFGGLFKKGKKEEEPAPKPPKPGQEKPAMAPPKGPAEARPHVAEERHLRIEPTPAPAVKDKGKELAHMVAEMKPLLSLAREKDVDIGQSKQLIDEAAVAGRERQLDKAIELVMKSKTLLMREIDTQLAKEIARLNEEIRVAREFGGDISRASTYVQEVARARGSGDVEAAYVYVDKVKKELLPITGRYNESKKKLANFKQLISNAETFLVDTKEARGLLVDAAKAMDAKDFDRLDTLTKTAQEKLYMAIPARMNDEMRKAKDDLLDAKMKNVNITPMITILKSATNLMKAGDYAQALREMREFKELIKNPK